MESIKCGVAIGAKTFYDTVFGEQSANHQQLQETGRKFICSLYDVVAGESMASAREALYTKR